MHAAPATRLQAQWLAQPPALPDTAFTFGPPSQSRAGSRARALMGRLATSIRGAPSKVARSASASLRQLSSRLHTASCLARPDVAE